MPSIIKSYLLWMIIALSVAAAEPQNEEKKCATFDRFKTMVPFDIHAKVNAASVRPSLQTSVLSPLKRFRIHYDTIGSNTPALVDTGGVQISGTAQQFVDTVARIFDSVWTAEVTVFGYVAPPSDNGEGGGNEYDIYIQDRAPNDFGETVWDYAYPLPGTTAAPTYVSYINIDNDYGKRFRTIGLKGLMSTAAHEFHHAIQIGGYGLWYDDLYFYELTAEAMEPTVYPYSKDYVKDINTYYSNIEGISLYTPFSSSSGYERAIWSIFLMKRYGVGIMRQMWESITIMKPIQAQKTVLENNNTTLAKEFAEFCYWNYFTGTRADSVRFYADAKLFPMVNIKTRQTLGSTPAVYQSTIKGFAVNYLQAVYGTDTAAFIIANVNMDDALGNQTNFYGYQMRASRTEIDGGTQLANGWSTSFSVSDPANWKTVSVLSSVLPVSATIFCYPNPFRPAVSSLNFGPIANGLQTAHLSVFTSSYSLVFSDQVGVSSSLGKTYAIWNGKNSRGEYAASGMYLYSLTAGDRVVKGKFAVVR